MNDTEALLAMRAAIYDDGKATEREQFARLGAVLVTWCRRSTRPSGFAEGFAMMLRELL